MKETGIVRRMDELGRIVLPIELRRTMQLKEGDLLEFTLDENLMLLKKHGQTCMFCPEKEKLQNYMGKKVCPKCLEQIKEL